MDFSHARNFLTFQKRFAYVKDYNKNVEARKNVHIDPNRNLEMDKKDLLAMDRQELQRLGKQFGIKGTLPSKEIVQLLLKVNRKV